MTKDGLAAFKSQLIVEKLVHFIIICYCFLLKIKLSIIATSCGISAIFSYLDSRIWALEYRSTHCASSHCHIVYIIGQQMCRQKLLMA